MQLGMFCADNGIMRYPSNHLNCTFEDTANRSNTKIELIF